MKPYIKVFEVPYWELSTEGIGTYDAKFDYAFDRFVKEARKEIPAFRGKKDEDCWQGISSKVADVLPEIIATSENPIEMHEKVCEDPRVDDCQDMNWFMNYRLEMDEDDFYDYDYDDETGEEIRKEKSPKIPACAVDAFYLNEENRSFEFPAFEWKEIKGKRKENILSTLNDEEKYVLQDELKEFPRSGHVVIRDCVGKDGKAFELLDMRVDSIHDLAIQDEMNWSNRSTSSKCKAPTVLLQDGTIWKGRQVVKNEPVEAYSKIILFTWV